MREHGSRGSRPARGALAALVLAAALAGCSSGSRTPELFPLDAGLTWRYRVTTELSDGTRSVDRLDVENLGPSKFPDGMDALQRRNSLGNHYWFVSDNAGIYRVAARSEIEDRPRWDEDSPRRFVIKAPVKPGTSWQIRTLPFLLKKSFEWPNELRHGKPIVMSMEIEAVDAKVEVPAGRYENCVLVVGRHAMKLYSDPVAGWSDVPVEQREWFCPGVGLAKLVRSEKVKSKFYVGGETVYELEKGPG